MVGWHVKFDGKPVSPRIIEGYVNMFVHLHYYHALVTKSSLVLFCRQERMRLILYLTHN